MEVKQLVGRLAGQVIDMPYAEATACIAAGTACLPEDEPTNVRGLEVPGESRASGRGPQSSSSEEDPASTEKTSSDAGGPGKQDGSEQSPSTDGQSGDNTGSPPSGQTASTPETQSGGGKPAGRKGSKGSK